MKAAYEYAANCTAPLAGVLSLAMAVRTARWIGHGNVMAIAAGHAHFYFSHGNETGIPLHFEHRRDEALPVMAVGTGQALAGMNGSIKNNSASAFSIEREFDPDRHGESVCRERTEGHQGGNQHCIVDPASIGLLHHAPSLVD
jgi:hypothetical protein